MTDLEEPTKNNDKFSRVEGDDEAVRESKFKWCIRPYTPYIDKDGAENIRNFKYMGGDTGIFYPLFWDPSAAWLVKRIPEWWNANTVS